MAQRVYRFNIVSPPNSPPVSATTERVDFPPGIVEAITVEIPAGHAGKTGIAVSFGNNQIIPTGGSAWMSGNKKTIRYDLDDMFPGGVGWFVDHYNSGKRAHTFRLAVEVDDSTVDASLLPSVLLLRQSGDPSLGGGSVGEPAPLAGGGGAVPRL